MMTPMHHLVGSQEIGQMLGLSRQRIFQITSAPDFPDPVRVLAMGKVWHTEDVVKWAQATGREIKA